MSTAKPTRRLGAGGRYSQGGKIKFTFSCFLNAAASDTKVVNSTADRAVTFGLLCLGSDKNSNNITETVARLSLNSTLYQTQPKFQLELNWGSNPLECDCSTWSGNEQVGQWKPPSETLWLVRGAIELSDFIQKTFVTAPWCRLLTEISECGHWGASWPARQCLPRYNKTQTLSRGSLSPLSGADPWPRSVDTVIGGPRDLPGSAGHILSSSGLAAITWQ